MSRIRTLTAALVMLPLSACGDSTGPAGEGDLEVELRNFTTYTAEMGEAGAGKDIVTVEGNLSDGNPTLYNVVNPGLGNDVTFTATWNGMTETATCTVTDITGISVPPGVVIQPFGAGFLDCVGW